MLTLDMDITEDTDLNKWVYAVCLLLKSIFLTSCFEPITFH
jgi:hypothetical protein